MLRFLATRLLATIPVLLVVAVVVFLILRLTPGDPAAVIAGFNMVMRRLGRATYPDINGRVLNGRTPAETLDLAPGELIQVGRLRLGG